MHLSYSEVHGQYVNEDYLKQPMPQMKLNQRNAIMLNCKDKKRFQEVYEKTIVKHFAKVPPAPVPKP